MVLVIDTSSARSAIALLGADLEPRAEVVRDSGAGFDLAGEVRELVDLDELTWIGVATGPGSFTGLRIGAAYAVGVALGRGLPLRPLGTLELQAARSSAPATGAAEAGRGRLYYLAPGGRPGLGEPSDLPPDLPVVGWLRPSTEAALQAAGRRLLGPSELLSFGAAAARVAALAPEVACDSLTLEYMQSIGGLR